MQVGRCGVNCDVTPKITRKSSYQQDLPNEMLKKNSCQLSVLPRDRGQVFTRFSNKSKVIFSARHFDISYMGKWVVWIPEARIQFSI